MLLVCQTTGKSLRIPNLKSPCRKTQKSRAVQFRFQQQHGLCSVLKTVGSMLFSIQLRHCLSEKSHIEVQVGEKMGVGLRGLTSTGEGETWLKAERRKLMGTSCTHRKYVVRFPLWGCLPLLLNDCNYSWNCLWISQNLKITKGKAFQENQSLIMGN